MTLRFKHALFPTLLIGFIFTISSCIVLTDGTATKRSTQVVKVKYKKPHPHGGPPGQTKKGRGQRR